MIYVLMLNDMRASNIENVQPVAWSDTHEELVAFVEGELVEPYSDGQWGKRFRKGGPLEWMNPPEAIGGYFGGIRALQAHVDAGIPTFDPRPVHELAGVPRIG